ncbi:proprotein convertase P-domain-containing protein [Luteolibacter sp. Populi]|uniref:proprotein convertase P-domain-containing protein n=1 Tax=Luteolibacter sp. Populi TaxID=3230487 RepID=UPI003466D8F7
MESESGQGSGVVAEHPNLFFTAAHVVYDEETSKWMAPPLWLGGGGREELSLPPEVVRSMQSRGYFRWSAYAENVDREGQNSPKAFSRDIALAWGLQPFFLGEPAQLDFSGYKNLRKHKDQTMITGYPALLDYTGDPGDGYLHSTTPEFTTFKEASHKYLYATHISTGPGNSGGPVWIDEGDGEWAVAGLLVSGRPSEAGIYSMTTAMKSFLKSAAPAIGGPRKSMKNGPKAIGTSTMRMVLAKPKKIPDGVHRWTKIPFKISRFDEGAKALSITVDLGITTGHRGDLIVALLTPSGEMSILHDGEGAGEDDLVIEDQIVDMEGLDDATANGTWALLVQDRLTGDPTVVTRFELEVLAEK